MRLICLRHGKAENAAINKDDTQRALTAEGKERLEEHYPILARYLTNAGNCQVWTSEKTRARQTAATLCRYMPNVNPDIKPFLTEADFGSFRRAISKCQEEDTVVIIGHEPSLSDWLREMTGLDMRFKKGRGVLLYLHPEMIYKATYIGPLDFEEMLNLELFLLPMEIGLYHIIKRQHGRVLQCCDTFFDDPEDNQYLHLLRVSLRVQYALLKFIQPYCKKKAFARAEAQYQKLYVHLGDLRGIDAIIESIHRLRDWQLTPLADALQAERNHLVLTLEQWLSTPDTQAEFAEALHLTIEALMTSQVNTSVMTLVAEQLHDRYRSIYKLAKKCDLENIDTVEDLRQQCKTMRYLFEFFGPLVNVDIAAQYVAIRKLNQHLGRYCDTFYNSKRLLNLMEDVTAANITRAIASYRSQEQRIAGNERRTLQHLLDELPAEKK